MDDTLYIDATDLVAGRIGSTIVPLLLGGKKVVLVNAEKAVITGNPRSTIKKYLQLRARRVLTNPTRGPMFPRFPDRILRRTVRGMLPYKTTSGREAYKRLIAYIGVPAELQDKEFTTLDNAKYSFSKPHITLEQLGRELGWRHGLEE